MVERTGLHIGALQEVVQLRLPRCRVPGLPPVASPREEEIYSALKYNVDRMKLIQLGITLTNEESYASWQFNMKDFDPRVDDCSEASIEFLKKSGIDFGKNLRDGVSADVLSKGLVENSLLRGGEGLKWITFHGMYDLAYLIKIVYGQTPLPDTLAGFLRLVRKLFGTRVYDLKHMAKEYDASLSEVGLVKLSRVLEIEWTGSSHQAGHDSLLTAMAFWKMKREFPDFDEGKHAGILYGFEEHGKRESGNIVMLFNPVALASIALSRQSCAPLAPFRRAPRLYAYRGVFPPGCGPVPGPPFAYRGGFPAGYHPIPSPYGYWAAPPQPSPFVSV
ncbi:probable CCR4-associated factor 1 homolog 9 [Asparagus officinalis]|nr:probable CCR4-associated factor 1 homolog 9 [Asparagus officinalis]